MVPTFCITVREDADADPPVWKVGVFDAHLDAPVYTTVPFATTRIELYDVAKRFCVALNRRDLGWSVKFNRQTMYNSYVSEARIHHMRTHPNDIARGVTTEGTINGPSWIEQFHQRQAAEAKAFDLLQSVNPSLANKMKSGHAFYLQGQKHVYIVEPSYQRLSVLLPEGPRSLCVYITESDVQNNKFDWALTMWTYLQGMEDDLLSIANHFPYALWNTEEVADGSSWTPKQVEVNPRGDRSIAPIAVSQGEGRVGREATGSGDETDGEAPQAV
jgi:hypothetical protein